MPATLATCRPWSTDDDATLRINYPHWPAYLIAHVLRRPIGAVYARASTLGIKKEPGHPNASTRKKIKAAAVASWKNPQTRDLRRKAIQKAMQRPSVRKKISRGVKKRLAQPEFRARLNASLRDSWNDAARREAASQTRKAEWRDPVVREKRLVGIRTALDNLAPEQVAAMLEQLRNGERAIDVANDWLISLSRVYSIAREQAGGIRALRSR